jgi:hypothetical protein
MRVVQALRLLRDLLVREGESDQVRRKLAKLFKDPAVGPPLKADLTTGVTALPTWMWVFLKPLVESDAGIHCRHLDDDRDDDDHHRDHNCHRQRTADDADEQRHAAVARPERNLLSQQKRQTAKRGADRAVKT